MTVAKQLLANNQTYAASFGHAGTAARPAMKLAIVTCMDARLDPARALGLAVGDAHVIRNAGGLVTDGNSAATALGAEVPGPDRPAAANTAAEPPKP